MSWSAYISWVVTVEGGEDKELSIKSVEYELVKRDTMGRQRAKFILSSDQLVHFKVNKKLKIKYFKPTVLFYDYENYFFNDDLESLSAFRVDNIPYEIDIVESEDSAQKEKLLDLKPIEVRKEEVNVAVVDLAKKDDTVNVAVTAGLASIAVFIRYFVVVDIVINLFGKINVELGPRI
jgi:hypothetical protein